MAFLRLGVPQVIAYWWKSPSIARCAAAISSGGGGKFGMPCARFTPPSWSTTRVISRMTDSVKPWTRREICIRWGAATGPPSPPRSETPRQSRGAPRSRFLPWRAAPSSRDDDVALDRIDLDAPVLEPLHAALEGPLVRLELEGHPAVIRLHVGPSDVDHDVEVLHEPVHDRLLDERRRKGQADTHAGHREQRRS